MLFPPWSGDDNGQSGKDICGSVVPAAPESFQTKAEFLKQTLGGGAGLCVGCSRDRQLFVAVFITNTFFSAHQRLLETTKDSASAACSPRRTAGAAPAPPVQVIYPLDWYNK